MRFDRLLQSQGMGTRRECRFLITQGRVRVEGHVCSEPDADMRPEGLLFEVDGTPWQYREKVYVMLNKRPGTECSRQPKHYPGVLRDLPPPLFARGVQPVGRLDADTTGLLLLTDDGAFIHKITSPKHKVPKVYRVCTHDPVTPSALETLCAGVVLDDSPEPVRAQAAHAIDEKIIELTLGEGKYHQVKRMLAATGNHVVALSRIAIGGLSLPADWPPGQWRFLEEDDLACLWGPSP
jgi:16S rRNA pseudouridine516 synthase